MEDEECLEYEALAERKRKAALQNHNDCTEGEAKKKKMAMESQDNDDERRRFEAIIFGFGSRKRSRELKKRGRPEGSKKKVCPEIRRMLGDASLHYALGRYEEAISVLHEVIRLEEELPNSYHILGLVHDALGNTAKAMGCYWLAACYKQKDSSLWKLVFTWLIEQGDTSWAMSCLSEAVKADPNDIKLKFHLASLYVELGNFQRAADVYRQMVQLCPENIEALKMGAKLYQKSGQIESSVDILEDYLKGHPSEADFGVIDLLASMLVQMNAYDKALKHIELVDLVYYSGKELPLALKIKAGICHIQLGNTDKAEILLTAIHWENVSDHAESINEIADLFKNRELYSTALKYYHMLEANAGVHNDGCLHLKIAECSLALKEREKSIIYFYKALQILEDNIDARLTLASLLLEDAKDEEAISLLTPPMSLENKYVNSDKTHAWWLNIRIKIKLCRIYKARGMIEGFVDTLLPLVCESSHQEETFNHEEHRPLIIDLCKTLASLHRYEDAIKIINLILKLGYGKFPVEKEELYFLGAQIPCNTTDPKLWFDGVRFMVKLHPHRLTTWNRYYKLVSRFEKIFSKHAKLLRNVRAKYRDFVPPIIISGHQFTMISHHQDAAREYLEAYKLLPENPLINLCVGTALINLALGVRLQNKHQCVAQGLAFLYNNLRLAESSQEALYNIARAYHHVGLVSLAASYYEKVLATYQKDCIIPGFPDHMEDWKPGHSDLRREAAYNLHLIYKKSGAVDLARQVLRDHCTF
ncbi:tetratricopeptide repeat (TPR)-containing protein [Citrus sinensis]|uniref:Tetratricopeptide repeat (TPR)-containing protein n=1 Tax=Citrus sinensis TaxID=2711 RepID=A0ACB8J6Y4_CITSI|nr:tetratricopeptide repeat (TPR)-containing protein [Citrus sinensis]